MLFVENKNWNADSFRTAQAHPLHILRNKRFIYNLTVTKTSSQNEKEEMQKEHVSIFGDDWQERHSGRFNRNGSSSIFGIAVLASGIILLLNTTNVLPWAIWNEIFRFWPVLLILWGVQIIIGPYGGLRSLVQLAGLIFIILVVLFAIQQVNPYLLRGLPPIFNQIFYTMKGFQK